MNTARQDNAGCIPTALWEQLPPHAKSTISNSQHCTNQQANSTTAHSDDHTDHSVTDTLPMDASNSVHYTPLETAPTSKSTTLLNSLMSSSHSTGSNFCILSMLPVVIVLYTPMVVCTLLIWPMSPSSACKPSPIPLDHLLMEEPMVVWLALMSSCWNTPNNMQIL